MAENKNRNVLAAVHPSQVPSREIFHRYFAGVIRLQDFSTEHPNPYRNNPRTPIESAVWNNY